MFILCLLPSKLTKKFIIINSTPLCPPGLKSCGWVCVMGCSSYVLNHIVFTVIVHLCLILATKWDVLIIWSSSEKAGVLQTRGIVIILLLSPLWNSRRCTVDFQEVSYPSTNQTLSLCAGAASERV